MSVHGATGPGAATPVTHVRAEAPGDAPGIRVVHEQAFAGPAEADLVDALRGGEWWVPGLSLVAEEDGRVVGHVLFTRAHLDTGVPLLALAPVGVLPECQRRRVGTLLLAEGMRRAAETDAAAVIVVGDPEYYTRFGFEPARELGILPPFEVPHEVWQAVRLSAWTAADPGTVVYPEPFAAVA